MRHTLPRVQQGPVHHAIGVRLTQGLRPGAYVCLVCGVCGPRTFVLLVFIVRVVCACAASLDRGILFAMVVCCIVWCWADGSREPKRGPPPRGGHTYTHAHTYTEQALFIRGTGGVFFFFGSETQPPKENQI